MQNIIGDSDITISKKNLSSLLKSRRKETLLNYDIDIAIINENEKQIIKILNKKYSDISIEYYEKNNLLLIQLDKIDETAQNLDKTKKKNENNNLEQGKQNLKEENSLNQNQNIFYQAKIFLKKLFQCSKAINKYFCCTQSKIFKVLPVQYPSNASTINQENNINKQQKITLGDCEPLVEREKSPKQINEVIQLDNSSKMNQQDSLENINKVISDILQYNYKEFEKEVEEGLIQQSQDQQPQLNINAIFRTWDNDRFNQANQNLSQNFYENRQMILREIEKLNYFICKQFFSQEDIDLFIGYFQNKNGLSWDYIFKIYYCSTLSDIQEEIDYIQKYDKDQNDQQCYIQISQSIHILVMTKKTFLLLQSKSKKFQLFSFRYWNKEFFNTINDDKPFQNKNLQEHREKCQKCRINKDCDEILNLSKFQLQQNKILSKLEEKCFFLCEYVNKGGEGVIFEGYKKNQSQYDDFIFKILFDINEEAIQNEIKIMKLFEININVIQFIDFFKLEDDNLKIYVFILEKCKYSLADQLHIFEKNKSFTQSQLFQIIFDLLDGLIQLRIYNILHLDIKPANILLSYQGNYVYTDFGISSIKKGGQMINVLGGTPHYESPEQKLFDPYIDFKSDVFSLGKTFQIVIQIYKKIQPKDEFIQNIEAIIQQKMTQNLKIFREDCLKIHELLLSNFIGTKNQREIYSFYIAKLYNISLLSSFDKNKDIPYIIDIKLYYNLKMLYFIGIQINDESLGKIVIPFKFNDPISLQITIQPKSNKITKLIPDFLQMIYPLINQISFLYRCAGKYYQSLQYSLESLKIVKQIYKENHPDIQEQLRMVGTNYKFLGYNQKALEYLLQSLQMSKQLFKENHPQIANSLNEVGSCYKNIGDQGKALEYQLEYLKMTKLIYKDNNEFIANALNNVGGCYKKQGHFKKALKYQQKSLQIFQQIFNQISPEIATCLNNVGQCYYYLGESKNAFKYYLESLQMNKQIYKENQQNYVAQNLNNIGTCYHKFGDKKIAMDYLMESLQIQKQIQIKNHLDIGTSLYNIGNLYIDLGDYKKALDYSLQSHQIYQKNNHSFTMNILHQIGCCYHRLGDKKIATEYKYFILESQLMYYPNKL